MSVLPTSGLIGSLPETFSFPSNMPKTLHGLLNDRAKKLGSRRAYTFEGTKGDQVVSFEQLDRRARAIAARLQKRVNPGDRVLLMFPAGIDFIASFFGCLYAGVLAVPTTYPKPRRPNPRLSSIAEDSGAVAALTDHDTLNTIDQSIRASHLPDMQWLAVDGVEDADADQLEPHDVASEHIAFLQYTSGSTSDPKGVMVSHGNLVHNLEMIRQGFGLKHYSPGEDYDTGVFWLPAYHDMGLIGGILESLYVGGHSVLMSPAAFLQRPIGWLEAMSTYKATITGAPNFAYELCLERSKAEQRAALDLSHWKVAFCGAEPIRPGTIDRFVKQFGPCGFEENAFYPCYGLAEGTLLAAGGDGPGPLRTVTVDRGAIEQHRVVLRPEADANDPGAQRFVSCGSSKMDQQLVVVHPETFERCSEDEVGEIWLAGDSVAQGYWNRPEETKATFDAHLSSGEGPFMRTGDLGFLVNGELVITGRVKDVIIIRGRNHYPQDIEKTVGDAHAALRPDSGAVFTIQHDGQEQVVATHEIDRQYRKADFDEITRCVRRAVSAVHELELFAVVLIRHANLPRTTSGKPQRNLCRQQYEAGELKVHHEWSRESRADEKSETATKETPERLHKGDAMTPDEIDRLAERVESWLLNWLVERAAIPANEVDRNKPFAEYGLDSMTAVELSQELEDWVGVEVVPTVAWNYPTPATLSVYLAQQAGGADDAVDEFVADEPVDDEFSALLAEIESLTDEEANKMLGEE